MSVQDRLRRIRGALFSVRLELAATLSASAAARLDRLRRAEWRLERALVRSHRKGD